jgi:hypothetical protein
MKGGYSNYGVEVYMGGKAHAYGYPLSQPRIVPPVPLEEYHWNSWAEHKEYLSPLFCYLIVILSKRATHG